MIKMYYEDEEWISRETEISKYTAVVISDDDAKEHNIELYEKPLIIYQLLRMIHMEGDPVAVENNVEYGEDVDAVITEMIARYEVETYYIVEVANAQVKEAKEADKFKTIDYEAEYQRRRIGGMP
jgi:hypothetical protein